MPDENEGTRPRGNPPSDSGSPNPIVPQNGVPGPQQNAGTDANLTGAEAKRELHWLEKLNFAGQFSLVIVGIIAASIYGCQLHTMNGQLKQMRLANYVACLNSQIARSTLQEIQAGGADSHNLAVGSILQAAAVTRGEAAQMEVRFGGNFTAEANVAGYLGIRYGIDNMGRTPANNVHMRMMAVVVDKGREPDFRYAPHSYMTIGTDPPTSALNPPAETHLTVLDGLSDRPEVFTTDEQNEIIAGINKRIFFYARIDYRDIFGVKHWTQYCGDARSVDLSKWAIPKCAAYNRTDTNQVITSTAPILVAMKTPEDVACKKPED